MEFVAAGGQGEVYRVEVGGRSMALKVFYEKYSEPGDERRLRALVDKKLHTLSALLRAAPRRVERIGSRLAHLSEFISGPSLEAVMEQSQSSGKLPWSFPQGLQIAVTIAQGVSICEEQNIAIGDIAANNLTIVPQAGHHEIYLLDLDNYASAGQAEPRMLGQQLYLSPELISGTATAPTVESDRYALGVLLHEILLLAHPKAGRDATPEEFNLAVEEGRWHQDPQYPRTTRSADGYPAEVLSPAIHRLFRQAQSIDPTCRPSAKAWVHALWGVLDETRGPGVYQCEACGGYYLSDITKDCCPYCSVSHPVLGLEAGNEIISLDATVNPIGRDKLGGSKHISKLHVVCRRVGPEYFIEVISSSGTWRHRDGGWVRLPERVPVPIAAGDLLRIGDMNVRIVLV
ncbi:MAG: protein kinase, partial [Acidimicrobiia bacterium]|nr:protein kinase [Acidimicrobiia bacterium]